MQLVVPALLSKLVGRPWAAARRLRSEQSAVLHLLSGLTGCTCGQEGGKGAGLSM